MQTERSGRLETLVDALARSVESPLSSPFVKETILVPSRAMAAWLAAELAQRHRVWANPEFKSPRAWLDELTLADGATDAFEVEALGWCIAATLPGMVDQPAFEEVRRYLRDDADGTRCLALAPRIARVFDRYVLYRPEMVSAWQRGEAAHWQARLLRALVDKHGATHLAARTDRYVAEVRAGHAAQLPERLSLFCVEPLAPLLRRAVEAIATVVPVGAFELEASAVSAPAGTLLGELQRWRSSEAEPAAARRLIAADDRTVSVHACHSPTRECEVLRDQMLAALQEDGSLEPRDMRVLCPDLQKYAPAIDAVFGGDPGGALHLPYRIADRPAGAAFPVVEALLHLLDVASSRMTAPAVVDLLFRAPIRERFGLDEDDVETVRAWVADSGIRWAADASHRQVVGQPALDQNTWRFGLDRLVLGYAIGKEGDSLYGKVLPCEDLDGSSGSILGGLSSFCEQLLQLRTSLLGTASLEEWRSRVATALEAFVVANGATEFQHQLVRDVLDAMVTGTAIAGFKASVPLAVVRDTLSSALGERTAGFELSSGGVTFVSLAPGRAVPARFVALLGMNDGDFPRVPRALGFDLMASDPGPGDPSPRDEDRRVFGEALLATRQRLVVTYIGRSVKNDAERTPSVVLSEMLDAIDAAWSGDPGKRARDRLVVPHALHAFSPRYFQKAGDRRLFSHVAPLGEAARAMVAPRVSVPAFVSSALPPPVDEDAARPITIDDLCTFFADPIEAFVSGRVGVALDEGSSPLEDREPFDLDGLKRWAIESDVVARARAGDEVGEAPAGIAASGRLPLGTPGVVEYEDLQPRSAAMGQRVRELLGVEAPPPLEVDVMLPGRVRVLGWLRSVGPRGQVLYHSAKPCGKHLLGGWIRHLAMLAAGRRCDTFLILKGTSAPLVQRFGSVDRPAEHLLDLVTLFHLGRRVPLPLFPDAAWHYTRTIKDGKNLAQALSAAKKAFVSRSDANVTKVYGESYPLDPAFRLFPEGMAGEAPPVFVDTAERVFAPLLDHLEEVP